MACDFRRLLQIIPLIAIVGLEGCVTNTFFFMPPWGSGSARYQPSADGPTATFDSITIIPNLHIAYAGNEAAGTGVFGPGVARFNGTLLEAYSADGNLDPTPTASSQPGFFLRRANSFSSGETFLTTGQGNNDQWVAWGRWFGYLNAPLTLVSRDNLAIDDFVFVIGHLTPASGLPQSGLARYNFRAQPAAGPVEHNNMGDSFLTVHDAFRITDAGLSVLWGSATTRIGLDLAWNAESRGELQDYRMQTIGGLDNPGISQLSLRPGAATFGGTVDTFSDCPQGSTCSGTVEGFFAGPSAERAGLSYRIVDSAPNQPDNVISGVAAFAFSEFTTAPPSLPTPPLAGTVVLDAPAATTMAYAMDNFGLGVEGPGAATQAADIQINSFSLTASPAFFAPQRGTATTAEGGGDSLITWGRWTGGTVTGPLSFLPDGAPDRTFNANQGLHYVVGAETPISGLPPTGTATATFNLLGATNPTWGDGAFAPGTFTGSMAVRWGGATPSTKVGANFTVTMPDDRTYSIMTNGGLVNPAASEIAVVDGTARFIGFIQAANPGGRGAGCSAFCDVRVSGFFAGPAAERAGIAYTVGGGSTAISGAAAFAKQ